MKLKKIKFIISKGYNDMKEILILQFGKSQKRNMFVVAFASIVSMIILTIILLLSIIVIPIKFIQLSYIFMKEKIIDNRQNKEVFYGLNK